MHALAWEEGELVGHSSVVMRRLLHGGAYDVGALGATEEAIPLYAGRGWLPWRGATWASTPDGGVVRTADEDDYIFVLPGVVPLDLDGSLTCDWRDGDGW